MRKVIIIGGGASGFFTAINIKENRPDVDVVILEKSKSVLQKVKVSGGGRCNVTHACFEPKELVKSYPRGAKELLGAFHKFMTGDTFEWFENRGVPLKIEEDGRSFPESNSSQTIISCFLRLSKELGIEIRTSTAVTNFNPSAGGWLVKTKTEEFFADFIVVAAGSSSKVWQISEELNHSVVPPVPSLFTFKIKDNRLIDLGGVSVPNATVKLLDMHLENFGPLLITHWGLSGPAVLKLSAFGARLLADKNYSYVVEVNWLSLPTDLVLEQLQSIKKESSKKKVILKSPFKEIPRRLWERLTLASDIKETHNWADISKKQIQELSLQLTKAKFNANGKSTFKEEFVTAGGIRLKEVNFKTFESKVQSNLYFVGEVLNIDAITGGFNFQNAWTSGFLCAQAIIAKK